MTDPHVFHKCDRCGGFTSDPLANTSDVPRCACCGAHLVAVVAAEHQAVEQSAPASPIVGRKVFRSARLRDPGRPCPVLAATYRPTEPPMPAADAGQIVPSHFY